MRPLEHDPYKNLFFFVKQLFTNFLLVRFSKNGLHVLQFALEQSYVLSFLLLAGSVSFFWSQQSRFYLQILSRTAVKWFLANNENL